MLLISTANNFKNYLCPAMTYSYLKNTFQIFRGYIYFYER